MGARRRRGPHAALYFAVISERSLLYGRFQVGAFSLLYRGRLLSPGPTALAGTSVSCSPLSLRVLVSSFDVHIVASSDSLLRAAPRAPGVSGAWRVSDLSSSRRFCSRAVCPRASPWGCGSRGCAPHLPQPCSLAQGLSLCRFPLAVSPRVPKPASSVASNLTLIPSGVFVVGGRGFL